jgi:hypothetical protein
LRNLLKQLGKISFALIALVHLPVYAEDGNDDDKSCSLATVAGRYSFVESGFILGLSPSPLPAADVGMFSSDGFGRIISGGETLTVAGSVVTDTFSNGTYTVSADCTGTASWVATLSNGHQSARTVSFSVADKGKELFVLSTQPGTILSGVAHKQ